MNYQFLQSEIAGMSELKVKTLPVYLGLEMGLPKMESTAQVEQEGTEDGQKI